MTTTLDPQMVRKAIKVVRQGFVEGHLRQFLEDRSLVRITKPRKDGGQWTVYDGKGVTFYDSEPAISRLFDTSLYLLLRFEDLLTSAVAAQDMLLKRLNDAESAKE